MNSLGKDLNQKTTKSFIYSTNSCALKKRTLDFQKIRVEVNRSMQPL